MQVAQPYFLNLYECIKDSTIGGKADIETFVITQYNRTQTALYNQKQSSLNISCATGYPHIFFLGSISTWQSQTNPETVRRLAAPSITYRFFFIHINLGNKAELLALQLIKLF